MEIKYNFNQTINCPHNQVAFGHEIIKAGSVLCERCNRYVTNDTYNKTVTCNYGEESKQ